ncbi:PP2C family protein-serine/threonine phosphatase [Sciscionella marina]|uniref:PP2C family protein-serine/threonine phosphatase n=1 Tax=Sciscionella marina TaxID=508770 RepID=UPI00038277BE|nr:PP2C family serine/threonine-protein phosphatase [Sciscionella marina]
MTLVLNYVARSDRGLVRSNNQDSVYAGPRLLAVADGMGGHAAGEVASKVVIAALAPLDDDDPGDDLLGELRDATFAGNGAISELVASDPDMDGMGTTLTAVLFAGTRLGLVHVGDSRAYLYRNGQLTQITHDDSFVQSLVDEGRITEDEAQNHPQRSLLLRALTGHEVEPNLTIRTTQAGDRYLLCSDGLSGFVSHETLTETIKMPDPQECADRMIELALRAGGPDNVTVIIADVVDVEFGEDAPIVGGAAGDGTDDAPPPNSSAARAQAITAPRPEPQRVEPEPDGPDPKAKRRKRFRLLAILVVVLLVLGAGVVLTRWLVLQQYYVGADPQSGEISVYQGVRGEFLGISLHQKVQGTCEQGTGNCERRFLNDFKLGARDQLRQGIPVQGGLQAAQRKIVDLNQDQLLPACNQPGQQPAPGGDAQHGQRPGVDCRKGQ